jgi:hypothetical protein
MFHFRRNFLGAPKIPVLPFLLRNIIIAVVIRRDRRSSLVPLVLLKIRPRL